MKCKRNSASDHASLESVDSNLVLNGQVDLKRNGKLKSTHMRRLSSPSTGRTPKGSRTSKSSPTVPAVQIAETQTADRLQTGCQSMLFAEVSPAKMSPWLAHAPASKESDQLFGGKCIGSFARLDPSGSWLKMYQGFSQAMTDGSSETFCETWPWRGTMRNGECFLRMEWEPRTSDGECSYWATPTCMDGMDPKTDKAIERERTETRKGRTNFANLRDQVVRGKEMWPTPRANKTGGKSSPDFSPTLEQAVKWPTPKARDCYSEGLESARRRHTPNLSSEVIFRTPNSTDWKNRGTSEYREGRQIQLQTQVGGQLNPTWVEWLMGFPLGWTVLDASETPSSRKLRKKLEK